MEREGEEEKKIKVFGWIDEGWEEEPDFIISHVLLVN